MLCKKSLPRILMSIDSFCEFKYMWQVLQAFGKFWTKGIHKLGHLRKLCYSSFNAERPQTRAFKERKQFINRNPGDISILQRMTNDGSAYWIKCITSPLHYL